MLFFYWFSGAVIAVGYSFSRRDICVLFFFLLLLVICLKRCGLFYPLSSMDINERIFPDIHADCAQVPSGPELHDSGDAPLGHD